MTEFVASSLFFGGALTLAGYGLGLLVRKKWNNAIANPILIGIIAVMGVLLITGIPFEDYKAGAKYISYFLTPSTVCLAIPLYRQLNTLKAHKWAILVGVLSGVVTSLLAALAIALLFGLDHAQYVTLLPKSITTAIAMGVCEELGGIVPVAVGTIILTGIFGNLSADLVLKIFRVKHPVAKGLAIGTGAHAIGTARALEMGELEGAVSGLSIAIAGLFTVAGAWFFSAFL